MAKTKRQITPFGKTIKLRLVELEMSQEELASMVGTTPQYINHIIYGERSGEKYIEEIKRVLQIL
ncbi:MAG: helix-turn-helix domain-containing protein [Lachnospiraceae bacterium]|nr:helix-turn-helix domain-containing protein [Lachnospiraceae bacterium]MDE7436377.1 helix-turn-helix domain-containing protein [Lachnospiraceae bacterium]